jgi:hypothetical protein
LTKISEDFNIVGRLCDYVPSEKADEIITFLKHSSNPPEQ